jgi:hypothetical protein
MRLLDLVVDLYALYSVIRVSRNGAHDHYLDPPDVTQKEKKEGGAASRADHFHDYFS